MTIISISHVITPPLQPNLRPKQYYAKGDTVHSPLTATLCINNLHLILVLKKNRLSSSSTVRTYIFSPNNFEKCCIIQSPLDQTFMK